MFDIKKIILLLIICLSLCSAGCGEKTDKSVKDASKIATEAAEKKITVTCAGDCTLGTDVNFYGGTLPDEAENQSYDYSYFLKNVQPYFKNDDLTIVNFEGTLTERGERQDKTFAFKGNPKYTEILTAGSVEAVTLANNHSKDYGIVSQEDTKRYLEEAGIVWFENLNTKVIEVNGIKVGLVGLYDLDKSAESNMPKAIEQVKSDGAELILIQIHWGIEGENYPEEEQKTLAHKAVDLGADLVIGHHPHVLQGIECYNGRMIAYSMGNFCFGGNQNPRDKDSMIYQQTFTVKDGRVTAYDDYKIIPCSISSTSSRNNYQPTPATGSERERIANKIQKFSNELGNIKLKFEGENGTTSSATDESSTSDNKSEKQTENDNSMIL